ncbi:hypothetical protein TcasGA2_TC034325 [Tribolium castaneum]|uniref:Uncharacterized protein n=1 Tax=Tribolium castaneum TaxID=7070 RepID=A0A139WCC8_TRICA|nr:hypothetical protein TcasGA2_TC034325 [Tribolium castaneum]
MYVCFFGTCQIPRTFEKFPSLRRRTRKPDESQDTREQFPILHFGKKRGTLDFL